MAPRNCASLQTLVAVSTNRHAKHVSPRRWAVLSQPLSSYVSFYIETSKPEGREARRSIPIYRMANLPQSLSMNVPFGAPGASAQNAAASQANKDRKMASAEHLVLELSNPDLRENALLELSKVDDSYFYILHWGYFDFWLSLVKFAILWREFVIVSNVGDLRNWRKRWICRICFNVCFMGSGILMCSSQLRQIDALG